MAYNISRPLGSKPRADSERSASLSPPRATSFTAINMNSHGEPRRLRHVSLDEVQAKLDEGIFGEDAGPEHGFQGRAHGTDFRADQPLDHADEEEEEEEDAVADEEESLEAETEKSVAPAVAQFPEYSNGNNGKRAASPEPTTHTTTTKRRRATPPKSNAQDAANNTPRRSIPSSSATITLDDEPKRGEKPGTVKKETARPWTDAECIALLELYVKNPRATHKVVADMHHAAFWRGDASWEGRSFSACQQRLIALNNKSRDRTLVPGVLAEMRSAFEAAGGVEADDGAAMEQEDGAFVEVQGGDGEIGEARRGNVTTAATQAENGEDATVDADAAEAARLLLSMSSQH